MFEQHTFGKLVTAVGLSSSMCTGTTQIVLSPLLCTETLSQVQSLTTSWYSLSTRNKGAGPTIKMGVTSAPSNCVRISKSLRQEVTRVCVVCCVCESELYVNFQTATLCGLYSVCVSV